MPFPQKRVNPLKSKTLEYVRPPAFAYRKSSRGTFVLHCERVPVTKLAALHGTPLYVYSASAIRTRYQAFDAAFRSIPHTVCYSVKANSNASILRMLAQHGSGFDVVSGGELERVLHVDRKAARRVVFSGVGKTQEEMVAALQAGILIFNVESESELHALAACAARFRKPARIALRVNPDVAADTHPYISTGLQQHKFGVPMGEARGLYALASREKYLQVAGVSVHIGSQITDAAPFGEAIARVVDLVRKLRTDGHCIDYVDAGGGLGIPYDDTDKQSFPRTEGSQYLAAYAEALAGPLRGLGVHLLLEPGRSIVGPAGALITRVVHRKQNQGKRFVVVDAAMNDLIRPALYGAFHEIIPVKRTPDTSTTTVDVVGPICETGDFFARDRKLPPIKLGDLLAILDAGAYGMSISSNYNSRPRAAEVLVDGSSARVVRRRETVRDLLRLESR